ncbi:chitin binding domain-containing protein [Penicillium oxalicum 114-2]|uniref:Chitin binding domain-containing protein n=1 Tax=Penicillium oxalicum (strain 114-2 / CGMCC 5302) TaxID=933388 RepID=S8BH68_PENO1|nr:chitin binding domain-containing protein [Penicillium oxalicum 114-2]
MLTTQLLLAALSATTINAHMKMSLPIPYGKESLDTSPLDSQGGNFPCKLRGDVYAVTKENFIEAGVAQQLHLQGQATHGGGSCQISLTEDRAPSKSTSWKVIQSFEGGCPANVAGNIGGDANAPNPTLFNYTIPDDFAPGKYTLAWTWFNRIGNREMYMNCAPVTVTKSSNKRSTPVVQKRTANYPPMFVANINGCKTLEGVDIRFPQPGPNPITLKNDTNLIAEGAPACSGIPTFAGAGVTGSGSGSGSGSGFAPVSSTVPGSAPTGSPSQTSMPAQISTTSSTEPTAPANTIVPVAISTVGVPRPAASSSTSSFAPSSSSSTEAGALTGPCSPEGLWNCLAGTLFQRCANGQWTPSQQMAYGTRCTAGQSSDLSIKAVKVARAASEMRMRKRRVGHARHY